MGHRRAVVALFLIGAGACGSASPPRADQATPTPPRSIATAAAAVPHDASEAPDAASAVGAPVTQRGVDAATAIAAPAPPPPCGARCRDAERHLGGRAWDYRKSTAIYRAECKRDESGPPEACRLYALAGWETRGVTLVESVVVQMLDRACARGDRASCTWAHVVREPSDVAATVLAEAQAACDAGDRSTCRAFYVGMSAKASAHHPCAATWWETTGRECQEGDPDACIAYRDLLFTVDQGTCAPPAGWSPERQETEIMNNSRAVSRSCDAGHPDSCVAITPNDEEHWQKRCAAGEQFACDSLP